MGTQWGPELSLETHAPCPAPHFLELLFKYLTTYGWSRVLAVPTMRMLPLQMLNWGAVGAGLGIGTATRRAQSSTTCHLEASPCNYGEGRPVLCPREQAVLGFPTSFREPPQALTREPL